MENPDRSLGSDGRSDILRGNSNMLRRIPIFVVAASAILLVAGCGALASIHAADYRILIRPG
jgi:low affinity Fe/Cu permease